MNAELLKKHIERYQKRHIEDKAKYDAEKTERKERTKYYRAFTKEKILSMSEDDFFEYVAKLWAMLIWGNKQYYVDKLINDNGIEKVRQELSELVWGNDGIEARWDRFRKEIKGMGPAMMTEILCHVHPDDFMIWNRRAYVGFNYLGVKGLPRYDYQLKGKKYVELNKMAKEAANEMTSAGIDDVNLLIVDYFIWDELQVEEKLSQIHKRKDTAEKPLELEDTETSAFIHNEVKDKLADIGKWLGFETRTEVKVAEGSKVDTVWESTIGNMGRVIYVFEVQTKGSIDSLIVNLFKALNNSAVQGVVAVSDNTQIEKIMKHAMGVGDLGKKLKCWDYMEVLQVHESLESVNEVINSLGLVPQGF